VKTKRKRKKRTHRCVFSLRDSIAWLSVSSSPKRNDPTEAMNETKMQRFQVFIRLTNGNIGHIEQSDYTLADAMESALDLFGSRFIACFPM
jgi:hypothetical protein